MPERLQKIVARAGIASRRAAEELVTAGRVRVNGRVVSELGAQADPRTDKVEVDGRIILAENPIYIVLHKPRDVVSTMSDPEGRPSVADLLKKVDGRVFPVGRLDFSTSGVLLVTNDGDFSQGMLHPRRGVPKTYVVKVRGRMEHEDMQRWRDGLLLEDGKTLPAEVHLVRYEPERTWIEVTIQEGRNQQIRRMGEASGFFVMRLARTAFAGINSDGLRPGQFRDLTRDELTALREAYGVPKRVRGVERAAPFGVEGRIVQRGDDRPTRQSRSKAAPKEEARRAAQGRDDQRDVSPQARRGPASDDRRPAPRDDRPPLPRDARRAGPTGEDRRPSPRDDRRPSAPRPGAPRDDRRGPPRDDRRASMARDDRRGPPRDDRPAPRDDRRGSPRDDARPSAPRGDRRPSPPRDDARPSRPRDDRRPSATRDDRSSNTPRDDRRGQPRAERPAGPRAERGAAPRDARRGAAPSGDDHRPARSDRRPAAARDDRRPAAAREDRRPAAARVDRQPAAARGGRRGPPRAEQRPAPRRR